MCVYVCVYVYIYIYMLASPWTSSARAAPSERASWRGPIVY